MPPETHSSDPYLSSASLIFTFIETYSVQLRKGDTRVPSSPALPGISPLLALEAPTLGVSVLLESVLQ